MCIPTDDTLIIMQTLHKRIDTLEKENQNLRNELIKVKNDNAEREEMYEKVIASYKSKLDSIYAGKELRDAQEDIYNNIISNLK